MILDGGKPAGRFASMAAVASLAVYIALPFFFPMERGAAA